MMDALRYIFWPLPPDVGYGDPFALWVLGGCGGLVVASFLLRLWRRHLRNSVTKRLSRSWPSAALWFGVAGLILFVARAESISFLAMRFLWVLWAIALLVYLFVQVRFFRSRHYEVLPKERREDPRERYLPKKKKKR